MVFNQNLFNYNVYNQFGGKNGNKPKWKTFKHNGVMFPEPYKPHKIPLIYDGEKIILDSDSEEYATIYAKFTDTEYIKNTTFNKNFFNDWKVYLKKGGFSKISELTKCDFKFIYNYLVKIKEEKLNIPKEDKDKIKEEKDKEEQIYKIAYVDGKEQSVGNFRMEPPGIFMGRGCHPKAGKIKKRILPEDITLNIDKESKIPELPNFYKDRKWGKIIHNNTLEWLASWKDTITNKVKYVWLGNKSDFKAKSDLNKFETARKLVSKINFIRRTNMNNLIDEKSDEKTKQLACALYLIDNLALRVGNEKGDDEADTVGVCSLRVEHIQLLEDNFINLDFLGKDSIRYQNKVKIHEFIYKSLISFIKNKKKDEEIFDQINTNLLNNYLKSMMKELTAKVFRTYNASILFQQEIDIINDKFDNIKDKENQLNVILDLYNRANLKVATLCNHQKNVSKSFNDQIDNINLKIKELNNKKKELLKNNNEANKEKIKKINDKIKESKGKKDLKIELKNVSLTTSKTNYIDPRITIAFLKRHNISLEKIFSQTLIDKFFWAMNVDTNWKF
jgi:DNA topoisomerase-1